MSDTRIPDPIPDKTLEAMKAVQADTTQELRAEQLESIDSFQDALEEMVNPFAIAKKERPIKEQLSRVQKQVKAGLSERAIIPLEKIQESAEKFSRQQREMRVDVLMLLRERIKEGATKEDILSILSQFFPDAMIADEALSFLLETTDGALAEQVQLAKEELNLTRGREIAAGKNIAHIARQGEDKGLGAASTLRDLYRDITGNPRDSSTLFDELSKRYAYKDLQKVIFFLLHSLGSDLNAKGPSISRGLLHRLITETRSLQAILGVYKFFRSRMALIDKLMEKEGLTRPSQFTFETLSKQFMALASDRYPTSSKALQGTLRLGIEKWIQAKIIALSQYRDAVRQVASNQIFKSPQHRDDLYMAILEALEELEDELEDLMDMLNQEKEEQEDQDEEDDDEEKR